MQLPEIPLPKFDLPFDISPLLHPPLVHFAIVLPIIILLLETYNLFVKRKSISVFSFMLMVLIVVVFAGAYITGGIDGKEAYDLLSTEGQAELKEHKLLGTYLLLMSVLVLVLKLLAMTGKTFLKVLFFVVLIGFIVLTFKQGKDGGELVYEHGANSERMVALNDEIVDMKEELEEAQETISTMKAKSMPAVVKPKVTVEKILEDKNTTNAPQKQDPKVIKALENAAENISNTTEVEKIVPSSPTVIETNHTNVQ